eukprot:EG_transcript_54558
MASNGEGTACHHCRSCLLWNSATHTPPAQHPGCMRSQTYTDAGGAWDFPVRHIIRPERGTDVTEITAKPHGHRRSPWQLGHLDPDGAMESWLLSYISAQTKRAVGQPYKGVGIPKKTAG